MDFFIGLHPVTAIGKRKFREEFGDWVAIIVGADHGLGGHGEHQTAPRDRVVGIHHTLDNLGARDILAIVCHEAIVSDVIPGRKGTPANAFGIFHSKAHLSGKGQKSLFLLLIAFHHMTRVSKYDLDVNTIR